jgi:hypothetical protein
MDDDEDWSSIVEETLIISDKDNTPPEKPSISGKTNGKTGEEYEYCLDYAYDPDGDSLYVLWDWGDDTDTGWLGPYESDEPICATHTWLEEGAYTIKAKLKDPYDAESDWASVEVSMPRTRANIHRLLLNLFQQFPLIYQLLFHIL